MALLPLLLIVAHGAAAAAFAPPHLPPRSLPCHRNRLSRGECHRLDEFDRSSATRLHLFGNLFGTEVEEDQIDLQEDELARFSHLVSSANSPGVKFDSLSIMISQWAKLVADPEKKMGLTTPVTVVKLDENGDDCSGVQLLFKKGKTGGRSAYQDKDDEKNKEKGEGKGEDAVKEGGVEVRVEKLSSGDLQVVASRCEIEEGTR